MLNFTSPMGQGWRRKFFGRKSIFSFGLVLIVGVSGLPARPADAADSFSIKNGMLLGGSELPITEILPALSPHALLADPSSQDLYVLGVVGESLPGVTPAAVGLRYGRRVGRSNARIVVGPVPLSLPVTLESGVALRGGVALSPAGSTVALGLSTGSELYFYDARTLAAQSIAPFGRQLSLAQSGLALAVGKVMSVTGFGSKIYAADAVNPVVAQVDLMTGTVKACPVDSPVLGLSADTGKVVATTQIGAAALADPCTATPAVSVGAALAAPPSTLNLSTPNRSFELSERVLEMTFPAGVAGAKTRRGLLVSAAPGASPTITVTNGTCQNTAFYVGDPTAVPVAGSTVALTTAVPRLALYAEQTSPGEDCVAVLTTAGGAGETLVRIRGVMEGIGANVVLLDRSFSMERSLAGAGAAATPEQQRVYALRQAVVSVLSVVTLIPATGAWAFLPFTTDVQGNLTTPSIGYTAVPAIANPDHPAGMRVRGFANAAADNLDPGGVGDLVQAMRSSLLRLRDADRPAYASAGAERRLWVITDGVSGTKGYGGFAQVVPALLRGAVSLHLTGVGGLESDPLMQQLAALSTQLDGERLFAPGRGQQGIVHTTRDTIESMVVGLVRSVMRGRPLGLIERGPLQAGQDRVAQFTVDRDAQTGRIDPWVMVAAVWEDSDATVQLDGSYERFPLNSRCVRSRNLILCAAPGYAGDYKFTLKGSRPGGAPTAAVMRAFVSTALGGGEVGFFPSFVRSVNRTGDQVRVQLVLNERGLPLRDAKVTAKISGPSAALGTLVARGAVSTDELAALVANNGDLSPGQAKGELLDPATLPGTRDLSTITLSDAAATGDQEPQDGVYVGQFAALTPGIYTVDLHAEYTGKFGTSGIIEDRLTTQVVVGLDPEATVASVRRTGVAGGVRLRFTPQDAAGNLLGPGQGSAVSFAQGSKLFTPVVSDYLDGSYRADVTGIDSSQPLDLLIPGSRIKIWDPADGTSGCSAAGRVATTTPATPLALGIALALLTLRRAVRRRVP